MFYKISVGLTWFFFIMFHNIMETSTNPVETLISSDMGYQIVNTTNLLAYQGTDLVENQNSTRNKRWLDELYSYFYDSSEEDSSSEEEYGSGNASRSFNDNLTNDQMHKGYGLCHNCTVTYNQVSQVQHINRIIPQTNQSLSATIATTISEKTTTPKNAFETKVSNSQSTEGTTMLETTSPNKILPMNNQQVAPIKPNSKEAVVTVMKTPKEFDASQQNLTPTVTSSNIASATAPAITETSGAVTIEASSTSEPATAAVITDVTLPTIPQTAETTEAAA